MKKLPIKKIVAIDLFCGAGGLTHGLIQGGVEVQIGVDLDKDCCFPFEYNNNAKFIQKDIRDLSATELRSYFPSTSISLLAGCAPCQPFSTYSRKGRSIRNDEKWDLLNDFGRLVSELQPDLVSMENVPQVCDSPVFNQFLVSLAGYQIWYGVVDCVLYCVPQTRKRLVLLASKFGPISLIPPTHSNIPIILKDVISDLPSIEAGKSSEQDALHTSSKLSPLNLRRIRASKPGGTWRDWLPELRSACHTKKSGETYPSVYGRMDWGSPAPTITTQCYGFGNGRFGHPEQDRAISLREAALIQTFPKNYQFVPPNTQIKFNVLGRLIGNAVPVQIGKVIAESFLNHIKTASGV